MNDGIELERLAHKFLWYRGYYVRTRTDIWIETKDVKENKITDIDILGYKLTDFLTIKKILIDCKSDEKGFSQVMRVNALKNFLKIDITILLRDKINRRVRYFANRFKHKIFPNSKIIKEVENKEDVGSFRKEIYEKRIEIESKLKNYRNIKREILFQISDIVLEELPYKKFRLCYSLFNQCLNVLKKTEENEIKEIILWLMCDIFMLAWLSLVLITSDLSDCPKKVRKTEMENKFVDRWVAKNKIITALKDLAGDKFKAIDKQISFSPVPTYMNTVLGISNYLAENEELVDKILRINDYIIFEYILLKKNVDKTRIKQIFVVKDSFFDILSNLNKQMLSSLVGEGEFPPDFFKVI